MPAFYKIDKERRVVLSTISGELTYAEALAHQRSLSEDRDFDPPSAHICDFSYATLAKISSEEVLKFAQRSIFSPDARRALIIPDLPDYRLGSMYEQLRGLRGKQASVHFARLRKLWTGSWGMTPELRKRSLMAGKRYGLAAHHIGQTGNHATPISE